MNSITMADSMVECQAAVRKRSDLTVVNPGTKDHAQHCSVRFSLENGDDVMNLHCVSVLMIFAISTAMADSVLVDADWIRKHSQSKNVRLIQLGS